MILSVIEEDAEHVLPHDSLVILQTVNNNQFSVETSRLELTIEQALKELTYQANNSGVLVEQGIEHPYVETIVDSGEDIEPYDYVFAVVFDS